MRSSTAFITSTGETLRRLMAAASSDAGIQQRSSPVIGTSVVRAWCASPSAAARPADQAAAEARIERVAERVAEQVRAEDREADRDAREQHELRRLLRVLRRRDREHAAPRGIRLGHAEAEERQRRPRRGSRCRAARCTSTMNGPIVLGRTWRNAMRRCRSPTRARRLDVLHLADRQHARPDDARGARDDRDRDGDDHVRGSTGRAPPTSRAPARAAAAPAGCRGPAG